MIFIWFVVLLFVIFFGLVIFRGAPYVPSKKVFVKQALIDLYPLTNKDTLVDLGSGGGGILREASKIGAHAVGYEINPILVLISRILSQNDKKIKIRLADFWVSRLPKNTTVVYIFSVKRDMKKLMGWMQNEANRLKKPIYLISFGFEFSGMKPIKNIGPCYLYLFNSLHQSKAQV